jgi:hypothetical protein
MRLHGMLEDSVRQAKEDPSSRAFSDREYRARVLELFLERTDPYLQSLSSDTEGGAVVTFQEYGRRNRDDMLRRIESGVV